MTVKNPDCPQPLLRAYMPELDSARGLAILLVLLFHGMAPPLNAPQSSFCRTLVQISRYGWVGVDLFFVLSGFLITGILLETRTHPDYFRRFYIRRALRILPALYATLAVLLIGGWISWRFLALSAFFLANSGPLIGVGLEYGPLWSLAVEEHFYLLWPTAIRRLSVRTLALLALASVLVTPFARAAGFLLSANPSNFPAYYTWFSLDGLALGALLAIALRQPALDRRRLWATSAACMAAGASAFALVASRPFWSAILATTASNVAFVGFLLLMLLTGASRRSFLVDRPFLKFFGFISYGLYLVHVAAFRLAEIILAQPLQALVDSNQTTMAVLLRFVTGAALGIALAYLSRRSLEEKFLRLGFGSRAGRPIAIETEAVNARTVLGS